MVFIPVEYLAVLQLCTESVLQSWSPNEFIFVLLAHFLSGWHSQISVCFREVLRLLVFYTGILLISNTAVLCIICLHKCSEDGKNNLTEYGTQNMFDLSQQPVALCKNVCYFGAHQDLCYVTQVIIQFQCASSIYISF